MAPEDKVFLAIVALAVAAYLFYRSLPDEDTRTIQAVVRKRADIPLPTGLRPASRPSIRRKESYQHWGGMTVAQWIQNFGYPAKIENGFGYQVLFHRHPINGLLNKFVFRDGVLTDWTSAR